MDKERYHTRIISGHPCHFPSVYGLVEYPLEDAFFSFSQSTTTTERHYFCSSDSIQTVITLSDGVLPILSYKTVDETYVCRPMDHWSDNGTPRGYVE